MNPIKLLTVALITGFVALPQIAGAKDWYVGVDVGQSHADAEITGLTGGAPALQDEGSANGFRLRGGLKFSRYFAVEAGYVEFGDFKFDFDPAVCPAGVPAPCPFSSSTSIGGFYANAIGRLPLGERWALYAHLGYFGVVVDYAASGPDGFVDNSPDNGGLQSGLGVGYRLADHWELQLDYTRFEKMNLGGLLGGGVGNFNFGATELPSLGILYHW